MPDKGIPHYYIWTIGCQMNKADSEDIASELEQLGYGKTSKAEDADIIILNSCVVRQSAENKVVNKLSALKALKRDRPNAVVALTGCLVDSRTKQLNSRFPHVDFFLKPQQFGELLTFAREQSLMSTPSISTTKPLPTAFVSIIQGCNNFCSYCIVPYRRGR